MADKVKLPPGDKPFGTAVFKSKSGQEIRVNVYVSREWLQQLEALVKAVNALQP
jgi:hypothetical protein